VSDALDCLTPADVVAYLQCGNREACALMRELGGWRWKDSWRIRKATFEAWLKKQETVSLDAAASGGFEPTRSNAKPKPPGAVILRLPVGTERSANASRKIRHTQPRRRKTSKQPAIG
jgi:hypothetical protein